MKLYNILESFNGSQNGHDHHQFVKGTSARLSDDLARIALGEKWVELATKIAPEQKAIEAAPANKAIDHAPANKALKTKNKSK
jgi:hypothetical protein